MLIFQGTKSKYIKTIRVSSYFCMFLFLTTINTTIAQKKLQFGAGTFLKSPNLNSTSNNRLSKMAYGLSFNVDLLIHVNA